MDEQARIVQVATELGKPITITEVIDGPQVTRYRLKPGVTVNRSGVARRTKISTISNITADIANELGVPVMFTNAGAEAYLDVPKVEAGLVPVNIAGTGLNLHVGKDLNGSDLWIDLNSSVSPHLLVVGTTGSGKTAALHAIIAQLVARSNDDFCELVLVDPSLVEFERYADVYCVTEVVSDIAAAANRVQVFELLMNQRMLQMQQLGITHHNESAYMPPMILIVDEIADLIMQYGDVINQSLMRIAQVGRKYGFHLILATQSSRAAVLPGLIRDNIPTRLVFRTANAIASRIALGHNGAELLRGKGDGILQYAGDEQRFQGCYIDFPGIESVIAEFKCETVAYASDATITERWRRTL